MKKLIFLSDYYFLMSFLSLLGERDEFNLTQNVDFSGFCVNVSKVHNVSIVIFRTKSESLMSELDMKFAYSKFVPNDQNILSSSFMPKIK